MSTAPAQSLRETRKALEILGLPYAYRESLCAWSRGERTSCAEIVALLGAVRLESRCEEQVQFLVYIVENYGADNPEDAAVRVKILKSLATDVIELARQTYRNLTTLGRLKRLPLAGTSNQ